MKYLLILFLISSACSVKIKNFEKYQKSPLLEVDEMPTKEELTNKFIELYEKSNKFNFHLIIRWDL